MNLRYLKAIFFEMKSVTIGTFYPKPKYEPKESLEKIGISTEPVVIFNNKKFNSKKSLHIVNWNLNSVRNYEKVIETLKEINEKEKIDVLTIQEGNLESVKRIQEDLRFSNSISQISTMTPKYFQTRLEDYNAILTNLEIVEEDVWNFFLPPVYDLRIHNIPRIGGRVALGCSVKFNDKVVQIITTRLENQTLFERRRNIQFKAMLNKMEEFDSDLRIVSGDLNSYGLGLKYWKNKKLFDYGKKLGQTVVYKLPLQIETDHILFSKPLPEGVKISRKLYDKSRGSDHYPISAKIEF